MNDSPCSEVIVFNAALQLPATRRAAYLNEVCGGDAALHRRVEVLLQAHERAGAFLAKPAAKPALAPAASLQPQAKASGRAVSKVETCGDYVGRYKLLQQIGEGGCGVVYMAEQAEPVRRHVALKVIKLGMDTSHKLDGCISPAGGQRHKLCNHQRDKWDHEFLRRYARGVVSARRK